MNAANGSILPEERLFNTIKDKRNVPAKRPSFLEKIQNRLSNLKQNHDLKEGMDFKWINGFFSIVLIVLGMAVIYSFHKRGDINKLYERIYKVKASPYREKSIEPFKPLTDYREITSGRNIFLPVEKAAKNGEMPNNAALKELIKDLSLAGIYQGQQSEVMIENKIAKKTYFLKQGDEINGIKIKDILKDRVILEYQGVRAELL